VEYTELTVPAGTATASHTWEEQGTYTVKARAMNTWGMMSDWTELSVTMPVSYQISQQSTIPLFFQILQRLMNTR